MTGMTPGIPLILAIECSTDALSVCVWRDAGLAAASEGAREHHSERLLPLISQVLQQASLVRRDLNAIAVGVGPGSFTGIRTAISTAQGLALALNLPVVPVASLQTLAWQAAADSRRPVRVLAALDARMGEIYGACYDVSIEGHLHEVMPPCVAGPDALVTWLAHGPVVLIGNTQRAHSAALSQCAGASIVRNIDALPDAGALAALAARQWARGARLTAATVEPVYVRNQVAMTIAQRQERGHAA
jgi:tRNA threonylcarbamoyladenosine biosynthesis protein TsaB